MPGAAPLSSPSLSSTYKELDPLSVPLFRPSVRSISTGLFPASVAPSSFLPLPFFSISSVLAISEIHFRQSSSHLGGAIELSLPPILLHFGITSLTLTPRASLPMQVFKALATRVLHCRHYRCHQPPRVSPAPPHASKWGLRTAPLLVELPPPTPERLGRSSWPMRHGQCQFAPRPRTGQAGRPTRG
jgi:hypothetical protein